MDFKARWLDTDLQRFISPDDIVPDLNNPQSLNRYAYVGNSPINRNDPSGHCDAVPAFVGDANFVWSCMQDLADAVSSYQSGNRNPIGLSAIGSGFDRWARETGDAVNQLNTDEASIFSNAPASERLPAAVHVGVFATVVAASIVGGPETAEAADGEMVAEPCSFSANTSVATKDGEKAIASIKVGDYVLSYNQGTKTIAFYPVQAVLVHTDKTLTEVIINGERIETTPEHPFFTEEKGWLPAGELRIGMHVREADGKYGLVWFTWSISQTQAMYNLTVTTAHTFFVGKGEWLVHNDCESLANIAHSAHQQLPEPLRQSTVAASLDDNDDPVLAVYHRTEEGTQDAVQYLRDQGWNVLDAPEGRGPEYHAERQLYDQGYSEIGISRQGGMCNACQSFFDARPNVTVQSYQRPY